MVSQSQFLSGCTANDIAIAVAHLFAGNLVAFPTETVYGLGADAINSQAVARIYEAKGRPSDHPLIVHIASIDGMTNWASEVPEYAFSLARNFWPGPMTLVLRRSELASDFITGGQDTVGVRVPNHPVALWLLEEFEKSGGKGVAAPSANRFGHVSPTTASAVIEELGSHLSKDDLVLDGGACEVGVESSIIDCTGLIPRVLRPGAVSTAMIQAATGLNCQDAEQIKIRVSGSLENHYSPNAKVILDKIPIAGQGFLALAEVETPPGVIRLAKPKDISEFAQLLYSSLRAADAQGLAEVIVIQPLGDEIAIAIRDRLERASRGLILEV